MPRPVNDARRLDIRARRAELRIDDPLMTDTQINQKIATEFGVSLQTVWYYLRVSKITDSRTKYTAQEREKLCAMSRKQLMFYASQNGKNFATLYAMVRRHTRKGIGYQAHIEDHRDFCEERDFIDFSRLVDLKAFSIPGDAFKEARKVIQKYNGLDLLPPNYIVHTLSKKFYTMNLAEQKALLMAPPQFIRQNASRIVHNWRNYSTEGFYFILVNALFENKDFEGMTISTHDTLKTAAAAEKVVARSQTPVPTRIIRRFGDSKSPLLRYVPGERVPKGGPDAGGVVVHVEGGDILSGDFPTREGTTTPYDGVPIHVPGGDDYAALTSDLPVQEPDEDDDDPYDPYVHGVSEDDIEEETP